MLLHRIFVLESGYGRHLTSDTGCCFGPGHVYALLWGVTPELLLELSPSVDCSAQIISTLLDRYDGDARKAVAAYTAGYGTVDRLVEKSPKDWFSLLDPQYQRYVEYVTQRPQAGALPNVVFH